MSEIAEVDPEGRHYSEVGGVGGMAVILGGGWAGSSSFSMPRPATTTWNWSAWWKCGRVTAPGPFSTRKAIGCSASHAPCQINARSGKCRMD